MGVELEPTEILICILLNALRRVEELEKVPSLLFVCPGVGCRDGWLAERKTKHRNSFSVPSDQILLPVIPELTARSINITAAPLLSLSAIRRVCLGALHCPPPPWLVIYNVKEWNSWQEKIVFQQRVELFIPASLVFH